MGNSDLLGLITKNFCDERFVIFAGSFFFLFFFQQLRGTFLYGRAANILLHSLFHSFSYSFTFSLLLLFLHFFTNTPINSLFHSLLRSPIHSPTHPTHSSTILPFICIHPLSHSFKHPSPINSLTFSKHYLTRYFTRNTQFTLDRCIHSSVRLLIFIDALSPSIIRPTE